MDHEQASVLSTVMFGAPCAVLVIGLLRRADGGRLAPALLVLAALVHAGLVPSHAGETVPAIAFALDAVALFGLAGAAILGMPAWRPAAVLVLLATVGAYAGTRAAGLEEIDALGVATCAVELLAIGAIVLPRAFPHLRPADAT